MSDGKKVRRRYKHSRQALYDFLCHYMVVHRGEFPTIRAIMTELGIPSTGSVSYMLENLVADGVLVRSSGQTGSLLISGSAWVPPLQAYNRLGSKETSPDIFKERRLGAFLLRFSQIEALSPAARQALMGQFVIVRVVPMADRIGLQYTAYSGLFVPLPDDYGIPFYRVHVTPKNDVWVSLARDYEQKTTD